MYSLHCLVCLTDPSSCPVHSTTVTRPVKTTTNPCVNGSGKRPMDLLQRLLHAGLAPLVTDVLLLLDPSSLHAAKQVCRGWWDFIQCELWERRVQRKKLRAGHLDRWLGGQSRERRWSVEAPPGVAVYSLSCDNYLVLAGLTDGRARVFLISSGQLVADLDCKGESSDCCVRGDLGEERVATITTTGVLAIWDKSSLQLVFNKQLGGGGLQSVVVLREVVVVAASDCVLLLNNEGVEVGRLRQYGCGAIQCAVTDGTWVAAAAARGVVVWRMETSDGRMETGDWVITLKTGYTATLVLHHPYIFAVGAGGQVGVWHLETGQLLMSHGEDSNISTGGFYPKPRRFWHLSSNGRFIAAAESNYKLRKFALEELREEAFPPLTVTLLDGHDMLRRCVEDQDNQTCQTACWEGVYVLPTDLAVPGTEYCCSTINTTCLVVSQSDTIFVWDFYQPNKTI